MVYEYVIGFVLLLGVLVFIHELGHFLLAKWAGVRVDTFSIGMGKKIFKFQWGETEYTISILPLGGYVKLFGQDPREEVKPEEEHRSFRHKALYKRALVVLAGPIFNAVLAVLIFAALYSVGFPGAAPKLARVIEGSPAYQAGFRSGDVVQKVVDPERGESFKIREYGDLEKILNDGAGNNYAFTVERESGVKAEISYTLGVGKKRDSLVGIVKERGIIEGSSRQAPGPVIVGVLKGGWADEHLMPSPFYVEKVVFEDNGVKQEKEVKNLFELERAWAAAAKLAPDENGHMEVHGQVFNWKEQEAEAQIGEKKIIKMAWINADDKVPVALDDSGILTPATSLLLLETVEGSPAEKLGLQSGDLIVSINDQPIQSFDHFRSTIQDSAASDTEVSLEWYRDQEPMQAAIRPSEVETEDPITYAKSNEFQIGASFSPFLAPPESTVVVADGIGDAFMLGWNYSVHLTKSMMSSFYYLVTGQISHKALSGPLMIGKIAGDSFAAGWIPFFRMMAFISLNLFILNLLPIPVLDGGHLIMYSVEAVIGRPLSTKFIEIWITAGFVFLLSIMLLVTWNDISRFGFFKNLFS